MLKRSSFYKHIVKGERFKKMAFFEENYTLHLRKLIWKLFNKNITIECVFKGDRRTTRRHFLIAFPLRLSLEGMMQWLDKFMTKLWQIDEKKHLANDKDSFCPQIWKWPFVRMIWKKLYSIHYFTWCCCELHATALVVYTLFIYKIIIE